MREAEAAALGAVNAGQEGRGAQVLLQMVGVQAGISSGQAGAGREPRVHPVLEGVRCEAVGVAGVEVGGQVLSELDLVFGPEVVFSGVALEPTVDHPSIEGDPVDRAASLSVGLDVRQELADEAQGKGALGQIGEVVHGAYHVQDLVRPGPRQGSAQVCEDLCFGQREQHQRSKYVLASVSTFLAGEVVGLFAQCAEVLGAAGNDDSSLSAPGALLLDDAEQGSGEGAPVAGIELDQDLVEAVEDHHGAARQPRQDVCPCVCRRVALGDPVPAHTFLDHLSEGGDRAIQACHGSEVEVEGGRPGRVIGAADFEFAG